MPATAGGSTPSSRPRRRGGVVFVDLDEFKQVNDRYGHAVGDLVLRRLAAVLRLCCREEDVLIRYGGDEFLILLGDGARTAPRTSAAGCSTGCGPSRGTPRPASRPSR